MSAGELEHEWAGTPGRMIRDRYRKAAEVSRVRGKLSCLLINDLDAGIGHFANTQITVSHWHQAPVLALAKMATCSVYRI